MKLLKGRRPSPMMALAAVALVFAMVGTAVAGPDAITSAIKKGKVKKIAKKQANKRITKREASLNVNSAKTADQADQAEEAEVALTAGNGFTAIAYVNANGVLVAERSINMGATTLSPLGNGGYCFGNVPFEIRAAIANLRTFSFGGEIDSGVPPDTTGACPATHVDYRVQTYNSAGAGTTRAFQVVFY